MKSKTRVRFYDQDENGYDKFHTSRIWHCFALFIKELEKINDKKVDGILNKYNVSIVSNGLSVAIGYPKDAALPKHLQLDNEPPHPMALREQEYADFEGWGINL